MNDSNPLLTTLANYVLAGSSRGQLVKPLPLHQWKVEIKIHVLLNTSEPL